MPPVFKPFTAMHGWALIAGIAGITLLILLGRAGGKQERIARSILAFLCFAAFAYTQMAWATIDGDPDLDSALPLHLCDIAAVIGGFALLTGNRLLASLTYFWGLAATVQGLATPAISVGFPHPAFIAFFVHHFSVVGTALYLAIVLGWRARRPWWKDPLTVWLWANAYMVLAFIVNTWLGTNFGFMAGKPKNPSLLDHMGDYPNYIYGLEVLAVVMFSLLALPVLEKRETTDEHG